MPFPDAEAIRQEAERAILIFLSGPGGFVTDPSDFEFRVGEDGVFEVTRYLSDAEIEAAPTDQPVEKTFGFRVLVVAEPAL